MNNKLFKIVDYTLSVEKIVVKIIKARKLETVLINRYEFEKWLLDSGRLFWQDGIIENYWNDENFEDHDIYDWIVLKWVSEDVFNIQQPLSDILGGHFFTALNATI